MIIAFPRSRAAHPRADPRFCLPAIDPSEKGLGMQKCKISLFGRICNLANGRVVAPREDA
jgi:hypothetical protein